jgi:hypothetical protein
VLVILLATAAILTKLQSIDKEQQYKLTWADGLLAQVGRPAAAPAAARRAARAGPPARPSASL